MVGGGASDWAVCAGAVDFRESDVWIFEQFPDVVRGGGAGAGAEAAGAADAWRSHAIIVAAGSSHRRLAVPGEETYFGKGVSHCASCDGPLFAGQEVAVVGGGN